MSWSYIHPSIHFPTFDFNLGWIKKPPLKNRLQIDNLL